MVAAVNGVAAGAGASLAFACDLRIVADTAGFNLAFANVALSCDTGSSYTLQRLVGPAKAMELLYFPRTIKADEALALGLATQVVPADDFDATVADLAGRLAAGPTLALGSMRRSVGYAASHTFEEALVLEGQMMNRTGATADHRAAVAAFVAKEKPVFTGELGGLPNDPNASKILSTWRGAVTCISRRGGCAPYSTVSAKPLKLWLNQPVMVPWQTPPQSRVVAGRLSVRATCREKPGRLLSVSTPFSGWWKLST